MQRTQSTLTYVLILSIFYLISIFMIKFEEHKLTYDKEKTKNQFKTHCNVGKVQQTVGQNHKVQIKIPKVKIKYILIWNPKLSPFHLTQSKQDTFKNNNCKYKNCYITEDQNYFKNFSKFDAVLFSGLAVRDIKNRSLLPQERFDHQKFVFATLEPAAINPVTNPMFENYFNWTWTFKLDSDVLWRYINIYDINGKLIGPSTNMTWKKQERNITDDVKNKFKYKTKAAAQFVSHCASQSKRENVVKELQKELEKYGLNVDVYGACGPKKCGSRCSQNKHCFNILQKDYYFYLSFENSFDEDYVTEKVMTALDNYVVPVVFGGANYSRFLPPGSYLNAKELSARHLAQLMHQAIKHPEVFHSYFKWRNYYKYKPAEEIEVCNICAALNSKEKHTTCNNFRQWWNGPRQQTYEAILQHFLSSEKLLDLAAGYNFTKGSSLVLLKQLKQDTIAENYKNVSIVN